MEKKILIFIDWYRPGYKAGGPITSVANLVEQLGRNYQFHILTRDCDLGDKSPYKGVDTDRWINRGENVRICYLSRANLNQRSIMQRAREAGCDTWFITGVYSWFFSILPLFLARRSGSTKVIVSTRGMFSSHALAVKGLKKKLFIMAARLFRIYRRVTFHATNIQEKSNIEKVLKNKFPVHVAPNLPAPLPEKPSNPSIKSPGSISLINLGRISPEKNTLKALEILSRITNGSVHLHLVGQASENGYWGKCQDLIGQMPSNIQVESHGSVHPDKLPELIQRSHFLFLPTNGENHGHAILECLSHGLPSIISDRTPWSDLQQKGAGWAIPLNSEREFENTLLECLDMDQESYDIKCRAATEYARKIVLDPVILEMNQKLFSS